MRASIVLLVLGATLCFLIPAEEISAHTFVVNSPAESHDFLPGDSLCGDNPLPDSCRCTLRAAIEEANALPGPDTVLFADSIAEIWLNLGPLTLSGDSTVVSGSNAVPAIDGGDNPSGSDLIRISSSDNLVSGLSLRRARRHAIYVTGDGNTIGGLTDGAHMILIGNGLDPSESYAVTFSGATATHNRIGGTWIGLYGNGTLLYGNDNGILITDEAHDNIIGVSATTGGNIISGNRGHGITLDNTAFNNIVVGNIIGPDITGYTGPGNALGGVLIQSGAHHNTIGGESTTGQNHISANGGDGITISGFNTAENNITGNNIGLDASMWKSLTNAGNGISIVDASHANTIGGRTDEARNLISGNSGEGILIEGSGTVANIVEGNYIGASLRGTYLFQSDTLNANGVVIRDGARNNIIGGSDEGSRNVISVNLYAGVLLTGPGTSDNTISGNYIGIMASGTSSAPNGSGVVIRDGANQNRIGGPLPGQGNIISGNRGDVYPMGAGVVVFDPGSDYNLIQGNRIGTNASGTYGVRNGSAGVILGAGASHNLVGGDSPAEGNLISGNGEPNYVHTVGRGIHIFGEGTSFNRISNNSIGLTADTAAAIVNGGHGIGIFEGATDNVIGGESLDQGNLIAGNAAHGVCIGDNETKYNSVRHNSFFDNDSLAIAIRPGAQDSVTPPQILRATPTKVAINYYFEGTGVDFYEVVNDTGVYDRGVQPIAGHREYVTGGWWFCFDQPLTFGDSVTAQFTDPNGNSSQFATPVAVGPETSVAVNETSVPKSYALHQNYPNPFNPSTSITYALPLACKVEITLFNLTGQRVRTLVSGSRPAGEHSVIWDGRDSQGRPVSSGVYLYRLDTNEFSTGRKMLLIK